MMPTRVAFRVDASALIGSGHIMRCLVLADELRLRGARTLFITRAPSLPWHRTIADRGHPVAALPETPVPWPEDAMQTLQILATQGGADLLVVDHYHLPAEWESRLRASVHRILAIDDIERAHDCDILLDTNILDAANCEYSRLVPPFCLLLLGPRFSLLDPAFRLWRERVAPRRPPVKKIIGFFGGADASNETRKAAQALLALSPKDVEARLVMGPSYAFRGELESYVSSAPWLKVCGPAANLAEWFAQADLALGANGTSSWERCCLGLPTLSVAVAENQHKLSKDLDREGAIKFLGVAADVSVPCWATAIAQHLGSDWLMSASECAYSLVDGQGARRVAEELLE